MSLKMSLRRNTPGILFLIPVLLFPLWFTSSLAQTPPRPPEQPASGPGGSDYVHVSVSKKLYGEGAAAFWLYEPQDPTPTSAPVVIFLHGWGGVNPEIYEAWISHLVRKQRIVIYPVYQELRQTSLSDAVSNAFVDIQGAFAELARPGHVRPDIDKVAVVGHSYGGFLAANYAAEARGHNLPVPKAVMSVEPGGPLPLVADYSQIAAGTLMLCILGDQDELAPEPFAPMIFRRSTQVSPQDKDLILMRSDDYGEPDLIADHFAPTGRPDGSRVDALDWYGLWKWMDALCEAAFFGLHRHYALGDTPEQRFMGVWSDGQPVVEPEITD